jgi:hypothetical protein
MSGALEQFPLLMAALKDELRAELILEMRKGLWFDQGPGPQASILGRNRHVQACQRLIRKDSPDAYYDASTGQWWLRQGAVDREILRLNRKQAQKLPEKAAPMAPVVAEPLPLAKAEPSDFEGETGVYERALLQRVGLR